MAQISRTSPQRIAVFAADALRDLDDIHDSTAEQWGDQQAKAYSDFLLEVAQSLADSPTMAARVPNDKTARVFVARWKNARQGHRIFFEETPSGILILRVLHTAQNWPQHLKR